MNWSDDRLDEFSHRVDERFDRVDERFNRVDERLGRIETDLRDLNVRFDRLLQALFITSGGIIAALLGVLATQL